MNLDQNTLYMKKVHYLFIIPLLLISIAMKSDKKAYQLLNDSGKKVSYAKMIKQLAKADVVFFGELHNNAISHWMELEITKDLYKLKGNKLILGAEMFESDGQLLIDEYLQDLIPYKNYKSQARLWPNFDTDYAPILKFAKKSSIPFIATNIPRRYASMVNKGGFEALEQLSAEAKNFIAPLPVKYDPNVNCYQSMIEMMAKMPGASHGAENIAKAQAIKDATMAHFIMNSWQENSTFFHFNGSYHSDNHEGIAWWIKQSKPDMKIVTVTTIEQDSLNKINDVEDLNKADFILLTDASFTTTY